MPQITYCKVVCYLCLCPSVQMCLATYNTKMARGRRLKVGAPCIMQLTVLSFLQSWDKYFWCDNWCSMLILCRSPDRLLWVNMRVATMNRVPVFILLFAKCKIKTPVYPKLIDFLHIVKKSDKTFSFYESAKC